jgi:hypothetical protein
MMVSYEGMEGGADADGQDFPQRRRQEVEVEDENNVVDRDEQGGGSQDWDNSMGLS